MTDTDDTTKHPILLVDPDSAGASERIESLAAIGCEATCVGTSTEALSALSAKRFELLILEIDLDGGNGIELLADLSDLSTAPPSIVYTRHGDNDLFRRRALEGGAVEFLDKSMGLEALQSTVSRHLGSTPAAAVASARRGDHALIIDDEPVICELIAKFMRQQGYVAEYAHTADAGRDLIMKELPLVLFLDIQMPGRSGLDLLRELNELGVRIPTMIITGLEEHSIGIEAEGLGIIGFLPKPFNLSYLKNQVLPKVELLTG
ncbi:MAG: response regulator [Lentisphaerae bacterium]|jgi:DNA-binding NtrC family response regulator|nr:response regulator [Lentisphaerota bacterium]MBT4821133.1 response regulator [Lentisphaerota bacterium]MBT5610490.1 response regulator [Lentisphaerota bacterium]MBT7055701.1 response regulator [Lentisphaerota bacterium]MBT7842209.1 response regulator [Lentisphaerota bacterium]